MCAVILPLDDYLKTEIPANRCSVALGVVIDMGPVPARSINNPAEGLLVERLEDHTTLGRQVRNSNYKARFVFTRRTKRQMALARR